jgi:hypothetical protein
MYDMCNITPKQKAELLFQKHINIKGYYYKEDAKHYAQIEVDEIIEVIDEIIEAFDNNNNEILNEKLSYYLQVKIEIEKL